MCSSDLLLADVRLAPNRFAGPGMIADVFGKLVPTIETLKIEVLDDRAMGVIKSGSGSCAAENLPVGPSKYMEVEAEVAACTFPCVQVKVVCQATRIRLRTYQIKLASRTAL